MANKKALKNKKNIIVGVCSTLAAIVFVIIVAIIVNANSKLSDSYFVSDGSKYVFTVDYSSDASDEAENSEEETYMPNKAHEVYTYSGETITGLKYYYEFNDEETAKKALDYIKEEDPESNISVNGKYVVITADESEYSSYTASDIKQMIESYQEYMNSSDEEPEETTEDTKEAENEE